LSSPSTKAFVPELYPFPALTAPTRPPKGIMGGFPGPTRGSRRWENLLSRTSLWLGGHARFSQFLPFFPPFLFFISATIRKCSEIPCFFQEIKIPSFTVKEGSNFFSPLPPNTTRVSLPSSGKDPPPSLLEQYQSGSAFPFFRTNTPRRLPPLCKGLF